MDAFRNQTESLEIRLPDANKVNQTSAHISYTIRPQQGLNINIDVLNAPLVTVNVKDVKATMNAFIAEAIKAAADAGIPVGE